MNHIETFKRLTADLADEMAKGAGRDDGVVAATLKRMQEALAGADAEQKAGYAENKAMSLQMEQLRKDVDQLAARQIELGKLGLAQRRPSARTAEEIAGHFKAGRVFADDDLAASFGAYAIRRILAGRPEWDALPKYTRDFGERLSKDLDPGVSGSGAELVPAIYMPSLIENIELAGTFFTLCERVPLLTLGVTTWPVLAAGFEFTPVAVGAQLAKGSPTFTTADLTPIKWGCYCPIPNDMLRMPALLAPLGNRIGAWMVQAAAEASDNALANGDGTATYGLIDGVLHDSNVSAVTAAAAATIAAYTGADVGNVIAGISKSYARDLRWVMHLSSSRKLRNIRATDGTPLYPRASGGEPNMIDDYPYTVCQRFPAAGSVGASTIWGALGDWRRAYLFGEMGGIQIASSSEVLFMNDMTVIRGLMYIAAALKDANAVVTMKTHS